jgi:N-acetylglutamate synthase-like GNAT family acetyltransferase
MFTELQINRYFLLQEMNGWLSTCGFQMIKAFDGFKNDENISDSTWHVIVVARSVIN